MRGLLLAIFAVFWAVILVLTGERFLALLAGANRDSELIDGLYDLSEFWIEPFFNMFGLNNKAPYRRSSSSSWWSYWCSHYPEASTPRTLLVKTESLHVQGPDSSESGLSLFSRSG